MIKNFLYVIFFTSALFFYSCMSDPSGPGNYEVDADTVEKTEDEVVKTDTVLSINAKFVQFEMGDASHYKFMDANGKLWDFGGCEEKDYAFAIEVEADKQNETNQGWNTNPDLKGKWFKLKYTYRKQPLYQDGPVENVPIILEAQKTVEFN